MAYVSLETQDQFTTPEGRLVCSADGGATHRYDLHTGNALYLAEAIIQVYDFTESELLGLKALIDARLAVVVPPPPPAPVEGE